MLTFVPHLAFSGNQIERRADDVTRSPASFPIEGLAISVFGTLVPIFLWLLQPIVQPMIKKWWDRRGDNALEDGIEGQNEDHPQQNENHPEQNPETPQNNGDPVAMELQQMPPTDGEADATGEIAHPQPAHLN
jgi:hypothetical protein